MDLDFFKQLIESWGYVMVFAGIAIESTGIPFPGETTLLVAAAVAASSSRLHIEWVIFWAALGAIFGDNCGYWAGRKWGRVLIEKIGPLFNFDARKQARLERFFEKHGAKTIFLGRFIAILRTWAAFFAGMHKMPYGTFLKFNALGGVVWAGLVGLAGFIFGNNLPLLEKLFGNFSYLLLGLAIAGFIGYRLWKRRREARETEPGKAPRDYA